MKQNIKQLQTVVGLAERELEEAGQVLSAIQSQIEQNEFQINSLQQYLQEISNSPTTIDNAVTFQAFHFKNTQAFINKIQEALLQEKNKAGQLSASLEQAQKIWLEKRARLKGLKKVLQTRRQEQEKQHQRQEQRMLDDLTHRRNPIN
ncbi:flagellar export protein FliJ [Galenea microaerophila]